MIKLRRYISFILLVICAVIFIVACDRAAYLKGNPSFNSSESANTVSSNSESCRLVKHAIGKTEVCGQPQKVAVISPRILDSILALGVQPAAVAQNVNSNVKIFDNPREQIPYTGKRITTEPIGLGSRTTPSLERLQLLQPDLIFGEHWQTGQYDLMNQIAPTFLFDDRKNPNDFSYWKNDITKIAKALGREDKVKELLVKHEARMTQAQKALQPVLEKYPRIFFVTSNVEMTQTKSGNRTVLARLLEEIGFEIVHPPGTAGRSTVPLSWEIIPTIESDLMVVAAWDGDLALNPEESTPQASIRKRWAQNPLLSSLPVFQEGRVVFVDYYISGGPARGPLSDQIILEALPDLLLPILEESKKVEPDT
ncbi:MAG: iron-siderophore ABC transporter substrate-binding protein [Cyanobacteria bacterium J06621_8]